MSWDTNYINSTFNAGEYANNLQAGRNRVEASGNVDVNNPMSGFGQTSTIERNVLDYAKEIFTFGIANTGTEVISGYDIVGIDGNQIGNMIEAILVYVNTVQEYLKNAVEATQSEIAAAIRGGEAEAAVKAYLEKVKTYVHNLVSSLKAFVDKLYDVGNAWVQAQAAFGQTINTSTGSFNEGSSYQDGQVTYHGPSR